MEDWKQDSNKRTLIIIRRSSSGQKENTSGETQTRECIEFAKQHGLEVVLIESIIETAYKRKERKKFNKLIQWALSNGIRHILFFWSSREARNLTDIESNDDYIKAGRLIIHHVSEGKAYWKGTPDSDFTYRELSAVINKSESRSKSSMLKAALKTKALAGWWPYRHTPLGYVHHKDKDELGNPIKGTAKITRHPDSRIVRLVQREFELRAQSYSYDDILAKNKSEGYVPSTLEGKYSRHGIEERLKNEFYWGHFHLKGDPKCFTGKHEQIIPEAILNVVAGINSGSGSRKRPLHNGDDIFRGWLVCGHPECQRAITYEQKPRVLKSGEKKVRHYYRCTNSRKIHDKKTYITEEEIWDQLEPAVNAVSISDEFAKDVTDALNETKEQQKAAIKKQMDGYRLELKSLEEREDAAYTHFKSGVLDETGYRRHIKRIRAERDDYNDQLEQLNFAISDAGMTSVQKVFELAIRAKELWKSMNRPERLEFLKKVCSNQTLEELTVSYQLQKPFARLASWQENKEWRRERDSNPR
jgi:DNA invertase Pin-like site-specific DNA recombinase